MKLIAEIGNLKVYAARYANNGNVAIQIDDELGFPYCRATANTDMQLADTQVCISHNTPRDVIEMLVNANIIEGTVLFRIQSGFVQMPVVPYKAAIPDPLPNRNS